MEGSEPLRCRTQPDIQTAFPESFAGRRLLPALLLRQWWHSCTSKHRPEYPTACKQHSFVQTVCLPEWFPFRSLLAESKNPPARMLLLFPSQSCLVHRIHQSLLRYFLFQALTFPCQNTCKSHLLQSRFHVFHRRTISRTFARLSVCTDNYL